MCWALCIRHVTQDAAETGFGRFLCGFLGWVFHAVFAHALSVGHLGCFQFSPIVKDVRLIIFVCKPLLMSLIIPHRPPPKDGFVEVELHHFNKCMFFDDLYIAKMAVYFRLLQSGQEGAHSSPSALWSRHFSSLAHVRGGFLPAPLPRPQGARFGCCTFYILQSGLTPLSGLEQFFQNTNLILTVYCYNLSTIPPGPQDETRAHKAQDPPGLRPSSGT